MNRLLVVTGGTRGIGKAIIERFAKSGSYDFVTCSRNVDDLKKLADAVGSDFGAKVFTRKVDMSVKSEVMNFGTFIRELGRHVDVLVNNSGYFEPGEIINERDGALEDSIQANLFSAYHLTRRIVPLMREHKSGHIFNMCSVASIKAYPNGGSYAISKAALLGFSRCLRQEVMADGIRVTAVMPGATRTASWDGTDLPDSRFMKVEDVAEVVYTANSISEQSVIEEVLIRPILGDI